MAALGGNGLLTPRIVATFFMGPDKFYYSLIVSKLLNMKGVLVTAKCYVRAC